MRRGAEADLRQNRGYPEILVLDSTDPAQIKTLESKLDLAKTIFIVSSKSGSTLEPNIFKQYFFERVKQDVGSAEAGKQFIAITDPGSHMQKVAEADGFRHVFFGLPSIGGRYSALSNFGDDSRSDSGDRYREVSGSRARNGARLRRSVPADRNPGVILGATLGTLAKGGRDKMTIFTSPGISDLGAWLEQLIAESTGKEGNGIIPVDREQIGAAGGLRQRSRVRLSAAGIRARREAGRGGRCARKGRPARRAHCCSRRSTISARNFSAGRSPRRWRVR